MNDRTTELESRYTHLQQMLEDLNEIVILQGRKIDQLEGNFSRLAERLETLAHTLEGPRDAAAEKPPHY